MVYNTIIDANFSKEFKALLKKFPSLKLDFEELLKDLDDELALSDDLGGGFKKIRMAIKSKGKGKRGGARLITYETIVSVNKTNVVFASIYNKGDYDNIDTDILKNNLEEKNR